MFPDPVFRTSTPFMRDANSRPKGIPQIKYETTDAIKVAIERLLTASPFDGT
jgi:hypothetical protein